MQLLSQCVEVFCIQVAEDEDSLKITKAEAEEHAQRMKAESEAEVENSKRMAARIGQSPLSIYPYLMCLSMPQLCLSWAAAY